jgi:hypothetical protein
VTYDGALVQRLDVANRAKRLQRDRCKFVDALRILEASPAQLDAYRDSEYMPLMAAALVMLAPVDPKYLKYLEGEELRGTVIRKSPPSDLEYVEGALTSGELPCGSWHQQRNGGRRIWATAHGEFEAR